MKGRTVTELCLRFGSCPDSLFQAQLRTASLGAAHLVELSAPESHVRLTDILDGQAEGELYKIDLMTRGTLVTEQAGRQAVVKPGNFVLIDFTRPGRWSFLDEQNDLVAMLIPHSLLPFSAEQSAQLLATAFSGRSGAGALICRMMRELAVHVDELEASDVARVTATIVDLLTVFLARRLDHEQSPPADTTRNALLTRIYAHIEHRLADPSLTPAKVAAAHHISLRGLQALLESEGHSVAGWIRRRRLERCRVDLLDPARVQEPVATIGARWGFTDAGHFSKVFTRTFGSPPGHYRDTHLTASRSSRAPR
ncbi:helix-turn-helix domain-containing protein [Nonomuraea sp. NPDC049400]|uniref:AraC-like ligand-binding domain-containing protein n=1 Tax=Nonomuraea sp. NPDC049400 TaxID=3364352 RepID=UPI00379C5967